MLTKVQCEQLEVVLVAPRNPLNIGAAARAMANFGLEQLTVVAPFAPHWAEAKQSAVGASGILEQAREVSTLAKAVAACTLVLGTGTLTSRKAEQPVVNLPDTPTLVNSELERGGRVAIVFGPEKRGLTREDLALCHRLLVIPTNPLQPSMNLGQAVAVCLYELNRRYVNDDVSGNVTRETSPHSAKKVDSGNLDILASLVEETMRKAGYSPNAMQKANHHDLQLMLRRLTLDQKDTRRLMGLFRRIQARLSKPGVERSGGEKQR